MGCRYCGADRLVHCRTWVKGVGWHGYTEPTKALIAQRLRARYADRFCEFCERAHPVESDCL